MFHALTRPVGGGIRIRLIDADSFCALGAANLATGVLDSLGGLLRVVGSEDSRWLPATPLLASRTRWTVFWSPVAASIPGWY